jgi:tryptophan synthase alpha chain
MRLERLLLEKVAAGRKFLAVYVTAGLPDLPSFDDLLRELAAAGADVVEVGIPFSDPVMDGVVIQRASAKALSLGVTPQVALDALESAQEHFATTGLVVMTYANIVRRIGEDRFADELASRGVDGAIVADLPLEESGDWEAAAAAHNVAPILLAAPNASDERIAEVCRRSRGFVYGVSLLGVTGPRQSLSDLARQIGVRLKKYARIPVGIGIGISNPEQAQEAAAYGDGVIVGSALVDRILSAPSSVEAIAEAADFVRSLRQALDEAWPEKPEKAEAGKRGVPGVGVEPTRA